MMKASECPHCRGPRTPALRWAGAAAFGLALLGVHASPARALFSGFSPLDATTEAARRANGALVAQPSIRALSLDGGEHVRVDGRLDDDVWDRAMSGCGFRVWDPTRGAAASEQTVFKVAYDHDAIYFAIACLEKDPSRITKSLSRRDCVENSDLVSVYIDPYDDCSTGYNFRVTPGGVQEDSYVFNDGNTDSDWDAVWQAETYEDSDGWYAEMRIPFSSIRYRPDATTWGLQVYRYMHSRGEDTAWVVWDRGTAGFVSRFGRLEGISGVPAPRQLEILPYGVYRATDAATTGPEKLDTFQNLGMDLKYGVTADMTLNATVQPDFGQVEADPTQLNLSPYETFYQEKRPFFVEGNRFFEHRGFNMFYSRRIGTGDENSRIRYAAKVTGKTNADISVAALLAQTDITADGQTHNLFKKGACSSQYAVGRFGKEFNRGNQKVNVMQTAVIRDASRAEYGDRASREAYTSGMDFQLLFHDRTWSIEGSTVGSVIASEPLASSPQVKPAKVYGTGGILDIGKYGGKIRGETWARWETGKLDLNDIGFLSAPDEISTGIWLGYNIEPAGEKPLITHGNLNFNFNQEFLYCHRTGYDLQTGEPVWSYERGHRAMGGGNVNGWWQWRNFCETWFGLSTNPEGSQRYDTRNTVELADGNTAQIPGGGPLIDEPWTWGGWLGFGTDSRKPFVLTLDLNHYNDTANNESYWIGPSIRWNQSSALNHRLSFSYYDRNDDTQHLFNIENPGGGIGGVSYVYGDLHQRIFNMTLRTNLLFSRCTSLEVYAQPYITVGDYRRARELARPDSYDLRPYAAEGFDVNDEDFSYSAVNFNAVFRWEYRPGSTLYFVWTHSRSSYDERGYHPGGDFDGDLRLGALFDNEAENIFLVKFSYWIPV
jgi:hypothetical protein